MKIIGIIPLLLACLLGFAQTIPSKTTVVKTSDSVKYNLPASVDSFDFCGVRFSTFRDCVDSSWRNCCSYYIEPTYVTCTDVGMMAWHDMPSVEIAEMNIKHHLADLKKEGKMTSMEVIDCMVLGNKVKAYHLKRGSEDQSPWSDIRMGALVNGQAVLIQLNLFELVVTNQQIPPVFRQIVTLAN